MTDELVVRIRRAVTAWREALRVRDETIRDAITAGMSVRAVSKASGLSRPGIDKILKRKEQNSNG